MARLVTDDMVEAALNYLATASDHIAAARANRLRAEFKRKRVRAKLILESNQPSAIMREAWAEAHEVYFEACEAEVKATEIDEKAREERNKAGVVIEAWRTENANRRTGGDFR
jgi:hypothetical protein